MKQLFTLSLIVFISGCAGFPFMKTTIAPNGVYKLEQATLFSPDEIGWSLLQHKIHSVVFARDYGSNGESAILNAMMYKVGAFKTSKKFLQYIVKQRSKQNDGKRFKVLNNQNKFVNFKGLPCIKYSTLSEDHKNKGIASTDFEYFKTSGYICRYPLEYIAFQMEVSYRSKGKNIPKTLIKTSEDFFKDAKLVSATIKRLKTIK